MNPSLSAGSTSAKQKNNTRAFTLIELSIALVIIGLIVGGVLVGQDLIKAAEMRSVVSDVQQYKTAVNAFRLKYKGIPGDITNASTFWPGCDSPATNCNGNGDKLLGSKSPTAITGFNESYRAWQQLADAGLIAGSYTGVAGGGANDHTIIGENIPGSKRNGVGYLIETIAYYGGSSWYKRMNYGNLISVGVAGGSSVSSGRGVRRSAFTAQESYQVDVKLDDGLPTMGNVIVYGTSLCRDGSATVLDGPYNLDANGDCALMFREVW